MAGPRPEVQRVFVMFHRAPGFWTLMMHCDCAVARGGSQPASAASAPVVCASSRVSLAPLAVVMAVLCSVPVLWCSGERAGSGLALTSAVLNVHRLHFGSFCASAQQSPADSTSVLESTVQSPVPVALLQGTQACLIAVAVHLGSDWAAALPRLRAVRASSVATIMNLRAPDMVAEVPAV